MGADTKSTKTKSSKGKKGKGKKGGKKKGKGKGKKGPKLALNWRVKAMYGGDKGFDSITHQLKDLNLTYKQSEPVHATKRNVETSLNRAIDESYEFERCEFVLVGSSVSKLAFDWSDIDITFLAPKQRLMDDEQINKLITVLKDEGCISKIQVEEQRLDREVMQMIHCYYTTYSCGFRLHISINDLSAVYTAFLLRTYHEIENRLIHVVLPIKQWAYKEGLLKPEEGKLSGYLITLMIIFYLQAGLIKPVLPALQTSAAELFKKDAKKLLNWKDLKAHKRLKVKTQNKNGLGELFLGFFVYYQQFDFKEFEIDIVTGEVKQRIIQDANYKHICIAIRDPFNDKVASSSIKNPAFLNEFKNALKEMEESMHDESLDLESFLEFAGNTRRPEMIGRKMRLDIPTGTKSDCCN